MFIFSLSLFSVVQFSNLPHRSSIIFDTLCLSCTSSQEFDNLSSVEDLHGQLTHLKAKLQLKDTELSEAREKYKMVCGEQEKLKQENASLLRSVTDERFER